VKKRFVLDAWAILALLQGEEPAASKVKRFLKAAGEGKVELFISIINLGEVIYRIGKVKGEEDAMKTLNELQSLSITTMPASEEGVFAAVRLKMKHPISYADAFAAATAKALKAVLVTGDPELKRLDGIIPLEKLERR